MTAEIRQIEHIAITACQEIGGVLKEGLFGSRVIDGNREFVTLILEIDSETLEGILDVFNEKILRTCSGMIITSSPYSLGEYFFSCIEYESGEEGIYILDTNTEVKFPEGYGFGGGESSDMSVYCENYSGDNIYYKLKSGEKFDRI